jgi:hypothetical protein
MIDRDVKVDRVVRFRGYIIFMALLLITSGIFGLFGWAVALVALGTLLLGGVLIGATRNG